MKLFPFLTLFCILLFLSACSNKNIRSQANMPVEFINIQHRIDVANELFKQHDFHESLVQWKILLAIQPHSLEFKNRIRALDTLIERRAKYYLSKAKKALGKNDIATAEWELLRVLALDPEYTEAILELKKIEADRAEKIQANKTEKILYKRKMSQELLKALEQEPESNEGENEQALFFLEFGIELFNKGDWQGSIREINKYLPTNPSDSSAISYLTDAHLNLSKIFEHRNHMVPAIQHIEDIMSLSEQNREHYSEKLSHLNRRLSANYYIDGVKIYREDIDQAINFWEQAIKANPNNDKAIIRLHKAKKMKRKLSDIKPQ